MKVEKTYVELGDYVRYTVSGFKGVVVAVHKYLHSSTRVTVQPEVTEENVLPKEETFDESQLRVE